MFDVQFSYALQCLQHPERFSIATLALLQQSTGSLRLTFERLKIFQGTMNENMSYIKGLYEGLSIKNVVASGTLSYPAAEDSEKEALQGMKIEFR